MRALRSAAPAQAVTSMDSREEVSGARPKPWKSLALIGLMLVVGAVLIFNVVQGHGASPAPASPAVRPGASTEVLPGGRVVSEGRLVTRPGAEVTLGTETGGTLVRLDAREGAHVKRGETLAVFATDEERASLAEARARMREAQAEVRYQQAELRRHRGLHQGGAETASTLDRAIRDAEAALAREAVARSSVERLEARIAKMRLVAPMNGTVLSRFAEEGETLLPGAKVLTLADLTTLRIEAEVDEYDVAKVHVGADVWVRAEGFGDTRWHGVVEEIPASVTTRRLKPADTSRPSDIRVLLVKIALTEPTGLKLGQRAEVEIAEGHSLIVPVR